MDTANVEEALQRFEAERKQALGIKEQPVQWFDKATWNGRPFDKARDTLLFGGLTIAHDDLIAAALHGQGYKARPVSNPDLDALQVGKEYGNRGQCNPTYFTVGNLVKFLIHLRDKEGIPTAELVENYAFVTASSCGPCRFGMYVTEYRKALRDAGFEGFRIMGFQGAGGGEPDATTFAMESKVALSLLRSVMLGDIINAMGYRMRPYEVTPGDTDRALADTKALLTDTIAHGRSVISALRKCRRIFDAVPLNMWQVKPKVTVIGEFWAMTTEGEGNYQLQRFLEQEGAEVEVQPITNWFLYLIWEAKSNWRDKKVASGIGRFSHTFILGMGGFTALDRSVRASFQTFARTIGLKGYKLTNVEKLEEIAASYYPSYLRGGEGHMEVGKLIQSFNEKKTHLVLSVKPFGCMPSSGVSDGVQSKVSAVLPEANFIAIETSGDGAVNVYSRVQMALYRAKKSAEREYRQAVEERGEGVIPSGDKAVNTITDYFPHTVAGTAANGVYAA